MAYKNINGAYFQESPQGLQAVSDPAILRQLKAGQLPSIAGTLGSQKVAQTPVPYTPAPVSAQVQPPPQQQPPQQPPVQPLPQDILSSLSSMAGVSGGQDYRTQLTNLISGLGTQQQSYLDYLKSQPTAEQTYAKYREQLGLPAQEQLLTQEQQSIQKVEQQLSDLESNINARISGMGITEPQRQRILASEQAPLAKQLQQLSSAAGITQTGVTSARDQLSQLLQLSGQEQTKQGQIAQAPMQLTQSLLPTISSLAQYQSPQEKLAQSIAEEQAKKNLGLTSLDTSIIEVGGRKLLINNQTGATIKDLGLAPLTSTETTSTTIAGADSELRKAIGPGGFVDINVYRDIRSKYGAKGVPISTFDSSYSDYLSPSDRAKFGIGTATGFSATGEPTKQTVDTSKIASILAKSNNGQNLSKLSSDELMILREWANQ